MNQPVLLRREGRNQSIVLAQLTDVVVLPSSVVQALEKWKPPLAAPGTITGGFAG